MSTKKEGTEMNDSFRAKSGANFKVLPE